MQQQDCMGKFVEFNLNFADAASLAAGTASKDLCFNGDVWSVQCYPRGAPDDGAGADAGEEHLSVHLFNRRTDRAGKLLFKAMVLGRGPSIIHQMYRQVVDYPKHHVKVMLRRIFRTSELAKHCTVYGYVTVVCGMVMLRHSPIPVPQSSLVSELSGVRVVQNRYGDPDVTIAVTDGKSVGANRSVLSARSPVLKEVLEDVASQATAVEANKPLEVTVVGGEEAPAAGKITIDAPPELQAWTFYALLVYIYCDRLPRDNECCGAPVTAERLRELLAAADRYQMHRLKLMCAKRLWEHVSVETVSRTLWYAHEYDCEELKSACLAFISAAANSYHVMLTDDFLWLAQKSPSIMNELKQRAPKNHL